MIRSLRQRHRHLVIAIGVFLPVAFVAGIAAHKPVPSMDSLPAELTAPQEFGAIVWERTDLFAQSPVHVRLLRQKSSASRFAVACSTASDFVKPDLIVYWTPESSMVTDSLPDNAILLGAFYSPLLSLPDEVTNSDGKLVLFSLADNEIVNVSKLVQLNNAMK